MKADLTDCLERCRWAAEATHVLDQEIGAWIQSHDPYRTVTEYHAEADVHTFRLDTERPPGRLGVIAGNVVHQLRSALDNLVWQLVILNGKQPKGGVRGNSFPILARLRPDQSFVAASDTALRGVRREHRAVIEDLQPYKRPDGGDPADHALSILARLSNRDKHQVLQTTTAHIAVELPHRAAIEGAAYLVTLDSWMWPVPRLDPGAIVGWAQIIPPGFHPDVEMKARLSCYVAFDEPEGHMVKVLSSLGRGVEHIVRSFQPTLVGQPPVRLPFVQRPL